MKIAIYPGSFDPVTNGHLDIISRGAKIFDQLIVAIAHNRGKKGLFDLDERKALLQQTTHKIPNVSVDCFSGLLGEFIKATKVSVIIRGLRAVSDFDYEFAMHQMNTEAYPNIDTIFLLASKEHSFLSSSILKEFTAYGKEVDKYTPQVVSDALLEKYSKQSN